MKTTEQLSELAEKIVETINNEVISPIELTIVAALVASCIQGQVTYMVSEMPKRERQK